MQGSEPVKVLKLGHKYIARQPRSAEVWLAALEVERQLSPETVEKIWKEARKKATGNDVERVWTWWLGAFPDRSYTEKRQSYIVSAHHNQDFFAMG